MKILLLLLAGLVPYWSFAGVVSTDTHYYITSPNSHELIIKDRLSGDTKKMIFKYIYGSIYLHNDFGYLFSESGRFLNKIDLKSNTFVTKLEVNICGLNQVIIHGDNAFIRGFYLKEIIVVNLKSFKIQNRIMVPSHYQAIEDIIVDGDRGYCVAREAKSYYVIDLNDPSKRAKFVDGDAYWKEPIHMVTYKGKGYLSDRVANSVLVMDLSTDRFLYCIITGENPRKLFTYGDKLFVDCRAEYPDGKPSLDVIDLTQDKHINSIPTTHGPIVYKDRAYLVDKTSKLIIVDLETGQPVTSIPDCTSDKLFFHRDEVFFPRDKGYCRLDLKKNKPKKELIVDEIFSSEPKCIAFSNQFAVIVSYFGLHLYDLDQETFLEHRWLGDIPYDEIPLFAGRQVYFKEQVVFTLPLTGLSIDFLQAAFTPINTDLALATLYDEEVNIVPSILTMIACDEIDLATQTLCTALSTGNKYARSFMHYLFKYGRLGGAEFKVAFHQCAKQWADSFLTDSDPETIRFLVETVGRGTPKNKK